MNPRRKKSQRTKLLRNLAIVLGLALVVAAGAFAVLRSKPGPSGVDKNLTGVKQPTKTAATPVPAVVTPKPVSDETCWMNYGRTPERTSDASDFKWGPPARPVWQLRMHSLMEFPPSTCDGKLYVNLANGFTVSVDSTTGKVLWRRKTGTIFDSTPAIGGDRLVIGGIDGNVTGLDRATGHTIWKLHMPGNVESSPLIIANDVYVSSLDGHVYDVALSTGRVRWAYRTGGDIKGSPSVSGNLVYVANYAGEVVALKRTTGLLAWKRSYRLDPVRTERIYSSTPVADGLVVFGTVGGTVKAIDALTGVDRWSVSVGAYVYSTPAISNGRVFAGGFDQRLHAYKLATGAPLFSTALGANVSGSPVVIGNLVYVSTLHGQTYAINTQTGSIVWKVAQGKYVPGIATNKHIYLSLNGLLAAYVDANGHVG